ncbi:MAG: PAS domain-containing sensor histidine kinase [Spirochaetales bacterium]|nr:PAS domain-containing sensor histidine kinase [Spirochaetales bacterium]
MKKVLNCGIPCHHKALSERHKDETFLMDKDGTILRVGAQGPKKLGLKTGLQAKDVFHQYPDALTPLIRALNGRAGRSLLTHNQKRFEIIFTPVKDKDGITTGVTGEIHDVTERQKGPQVSAQSLLMANTQLEQRLQGMQLRLEEDEPMSTLGRMVAGVTHEINTPVGIAKTGISFIEEKIEEIQNLFSTGKMSLSHLEEGLAIIAESASSAHRSLDRAVEMIRSFKNIAVDQHCEDIRVFNLKEAVEEILVSFRNMLKHARCEVEVGCDPNIYVESSPGILFQIITNLVRNTLSHGIPKSGTPLIRIQLGDENNMLALRYEDNGPGLNEEGHQKIFEAFYTTRRESGGTGLGMHILYNMITHALGGTIECPPSSPEEGFICSIRYPVEFAARSQVH